MKKRSLLVNQFVSLIINFALIVIFINLVSLRSASAQTNLRSIWVGAVASSLAYSLKKCGPSNAERLRIAGNRNGFLPSTDQEINEMQETTIELLKEYNPSRRNKWCWQMKNGIDLGAAL